MRGGVALVALVGIILAVGPYRSRVSADLTSLRRKVVPTAAYIDGERASSGPEGALHPEPELTDKTILLGSKEFPSTITGPGQRVVTVKVGSGGNADNGPVDLFKIGLVAGVVGEAPPQHPAPHDIVVVAYGKEGEERARITWALRDDTTFQSHAFRVTKVSRIDLFVLDLYTGPERQGQTYTLDQVELFALT